jgi:hypothetical protein
MEDQNLFILPPCRLVQGSLYTPQTTDAEGKPLTIRTGPNAGKPRVNYYFAVAIPKGREQLWSETEWGRIIFAVGYAAMPNHAGLPEFAWKIGDGDSAIPNSEGNRPCDNDGFKGCWIVRLSGGFPPTLFDVDTMQPLLEPDFINLGDYVEVAGNVTSNNSKQNPGVYLNHTHVGFRAYGQRIIVKQQIDPKTLGFGKRPLPPGASPTPPASANGGPTSPSKPPAPPSNPTAPVPHTGILNPPPPPSPPSGPVMTAKANGATYEQMIATGWTHAQLQQHGYIQ